MCGIVGFTGNRQAAPILLDGLSKLEYRGYYEKTETDNLFNDDGSHPNEAGSNLAAETIAEVILKDANA